MTQKLIYVSAIIAALFTGMLAMSANNVRADGTGSCPCGNGKGFWTCANCDSFTEQPQIQQLNYHKHGHGTTVIINNNPSSSSTSSSDQTTQQQGGDSSSDSGSSSDNSNDNSYTTTAKVNMVSLSFRTDNCFWSYPVICN